MGFSVNIFWSSRARVPKHLGLKMVWLMTCSGTLSTPTELDLAELNAGESDLRALREACLTGSPFCKIIVNRRTAVSQAGHEIYPVDAMWNFLPWIFPGSRGTSSWIFWTFVEWRLRAMWTQGWMAGQVSDPCIEGEYCNLYNTYSLSFFTFFHTMYVIYIYIHINVLYRYDKYINI